MQYQQKLNFYRVENPLYIADFLKHFFLLIGYFDDALAIGAQGGRGAQRNRQAVFILKNRGLTLMPALFLSQFI